MKKAKTNLPGEEPTSLHQTGLIFSMKNVCFIGGGLLSAQGTHLLMERNGWHGLQGHWTLGHTSTLGKKEWKMLHTDTKMVRAGQWKHSS